MVLTFVVAPAVYGAEGGVRGTVRAVLRLPAIWAMGVALLVRNLGLPVPVGIGRGIELLSQATLPVLLLALGVQLGASRGLTITRAKDGHGLGHRLCGALSALGRSEVHHGDLAAGGRRFRSRVGVGVAVGWYPRRESNLRTWFRNATQGV